MQTITLAELDDKLFQAQTAYFHTSTTEGRPGHSTSPERCYQCQMSAKASATTVAPLLGLLEAPR